MLSHTASSPFPGSPQEGPTTFSPQLTQRVLQKTRLRRSELADLIHVLLTPFNNHYFTLTAFLYWSTIFSLETGGSTAGGRRSQALGHGASIFLSTVKWVAIRISPLHAFCQYSF